MIGPGLRSTRSYACAYVDPVFTSQRYDISISISTREERTCPFFLVLTAYTYVDPVFAGLLTHDCACTYAYALVKTRLRTGVIRTCVLVSLRPRAKTILR